MKCYYHPKDDAVGICKNCNRGLCKACAVDVDNGIACIDSCEEAVKEINRIVSRNKKLPERTAASYYRQAIWLIIIGLFFVLTGVITSVLTLDWFGVYFMIPIGFLFFLGGLLVYLSGRKLVEQ